VKSEIAVLDLICNRLSTNLSEEILIGAARLCLSPRVGGSICANVEIVEASGGPELLRTILNSLLMAGEAASSTSRRISAPSSPRPFAAQTNESPVPAADFLRASERRREVRQRVFKRGLLHVVGAGGTFNCMVRNISSGGAGLRLDAAFAVPESCEFEVVGSGTRRRVAVRWQAGIDLGVEYLTKR
jgi:hypothetical protein